MTGRKLLLADDSVTIQKVIDLTFSDEGMQVITVGDGEQAIRQLEEVTPDIVLADVFMPGVDGYRLCEFVKQSEKFKHIPVMLLVGSFEPFDEAEARRVGADDFVTKPFQSIRQLVSRVGSLLSGKTDNHEAVTRELAPLGLETKAGTGEMQEERMPTPPLANQPVVNEQDETDIAFQTADTLRLKPEFSAEHELNVVDSNNKVTETKPMEIITEPSTPVAFSDALLDLDEFESDLAGPEIDDVILDLEYDEAPAPIQTAVVAEQPQPALEYSAVSSVTVPVSGYEPPAIEAGFPEPQESSWAIVEEPPVIEQPPAADASSAPVAEAATAEVHEKPLVNQVASSELSPEAIEAIARRVVEQLSEKVVREIAWEVVPELSELLIKQRLDEQNR